MAITRKKKEEILKNVEDIVKNSLTLVFTNFKGLTVAQATEMRRALKTQGLKYTVTKKTLLKRALQGSKIQGAMPDMAGEIALVSGTDELAPARELAVFVKKYPEQLFFAGGVFGGRYVGIDEMKSIASIPPLEVLRAQFVHIINSPLQKLAIVLSERAKKLPA
ncbi:MAG: 50S ribosomal protein L10 [Patescibacteria group bacterium]|nr:50S ribosomal protein L10 [Patescibacteria group bacterium]